MKGVKGFKANRLQQGLRVPSKKIKHRSRGLRRKNHSAHASRRHLAAFAAMVQGVWCRLFDTSRIASGVVPRRAVR